MSANRISKIVRGLKTITRKEEHLSFSSVNLRQFCEEVQVFFLAKKDDVTITISEIPDRDVYFSPDKIAQVIINLVNNALDAMDTIEENKWVKIFFDISEKKQALTIKVQNAGPKISEEVLKKIEMPFFTTKKTGKGTGLGLTISKKIAEEHSGNLYCDRSEEYTTFVLEFPLNLKQDNLAS